MVFYKSPLFQTGLVRNLPCFRWSVRVQFPMEVDVMKLFALSNAPENFADFSAAVGSADNYNLPYRLLY